ncbi:MAG: response regulator transcription factor [Dehalococcoidia bacterium]|nr:response regulator transcription factor [Dehalococcoidia bacterium]
MRILVVDDDRRLCNIVKRGLQEDGYAVDLAYDGQEGEDLAGINPYDLIILDVMMPKKDGVAVCQSLRDDKINTPILILTAKDAVEDRVKGLDAGADDYLVKPFAFSELLARIRALLRRGGTSRSPEIQVGNLVLNTLSREARIGPKAIELTSKEYVILEYFMRHPNMVITRTMIEEHAWDYDFDSISNLVDVYIRRLRRKIDDENEESLIQTMRGAGYRLKAP